MKRILRYVLWALVAAGCVLFQLLDGHGGLVFSHAIALPFNLLGQGLRALSLSGTAGNITAILLYILLSLLPLLGLLPLKRTHHWEDWLLVLSVPVLLLVYWCNINPGRLFRLSVELEQAYLGAAIWMLLLSYALLRLLRSCFEGEARRALALLLEALGVVFVTAICGSCFGGYLDERTAFLAANTGGHSLTEGFVALHYLILALPYVLDLWVLTSARALLDAAAADRYSAVTVCAAAKLATRCRTVLSVSLLSTAGFNLLQLLALPTLRVSSLQVTLPLSSLLFVLLVLLLSRQYAEGKTLKDDNDTII